MKILKNFVAVDWRSGKDRIYFFFKDDNTYSRFDIGDNTTHDGHPTRVNYNNWHDVHKHIKDLRFGFATNSGRNPENPDQDLLWLFFYNQETPMFCCYDQDKDQVSHFGTVQHSLWHDILPYFKNIIAGTWWSNPFSGPNSYRFLMSNGQSLTHLHVRNYTLAQRLTVEPINDSAWPGLAPYKHRIITAAQNDRTFADSYLYIFLTDNEYIAYNIPENKVAYGPAKIDNRNWPGLLRDPEPEPVISADILDAVNFGVASTTRPSKK